IEQAWSKALDEVVVTGTRTPKLLKDSPILTRVISENDIRKIDATNISDLLQAELPGVEFSFAMNQQVSLNMQGFGGNAVLFLVDGERLAGETLDNPDYSRLNLANIGKIEIVKGAASSLYGSNAVGGVINLISKENARPWSVNLNARYGAHNEQRYGANIGFNIGKFNSATSVQHTFINSYDMRNQGDFTRFYGGHTWNFKERLTCNVTDKLKLIGRAGYFFRQREASESVKDRYRDFGAGLRGTYKISDSNDLEAAYSFDQYDKSDFITASGKDIRKYSNVQNSAKLVYNHTFSGKHILTVGGDIMRDYLQTYQFTDNGNRSQITADGFAQFDMNFLKNLNIIAGGRYDYFSEAAMSSLTSRVSMMYKTGRCSLRGSYAGGFRAPTLKEMYMDFDMAGIFMIYGNPDLKPEKSHNFQISAEYTRGLLNFNIGGFLNLVDDRITTGWSQPLKGMVYTNISRVDISGIDANVSWRTPWGLSTRLSYIFTHEKVAKGQPYTSSTRPHTATMRIDYTKRWHNYGFTAALNGRVLSAGPVAEYPSPPADEDVEKVYYPADP
ncbi:MAG: TonB-dependent receptor, partial [Muribaculaceae bacterium]|nr:TonB-dependent receptor [Muribaculaceae bacterium]